MSLVPTCDLLDTAWRSRTAVGAFNVINLEYAEAVAAAATRCRAHAIMQISANAVRFHDGRVEPLVRACVAVADTAQAPIALHLDHADDLDLCRRAVAAGCSSVMFDPAAAHSKSAVIATARAVAWARSEGVWIEGELDDIDGKPGMRTTGKSDPESAARFVAKTGVDALAVAVGSRHKMTSATAKLDYELIARLRDAVPVPLVLHGSSGVPDASLRQAAVCGIAKINVGTRLSTAFARALCEHLGDNPPNDPRAALDAARSAASSEAERVIRALHGMEPRDAGPLER